MKKIFAIFIFIGILLQAFSQAIIVGGYYVNKDYISRNLCENRNKPSMHCEGKCCLKKRLAKEAKEQAPSPRNQKQEQSVTLFFNFTKPEIKFPPANSTNQRYYSYNDLQTSSYCCTVFHPPTV